MPRRGSRKRVSRRKMRGSRKSRSRSRRSSRRFGAKKFEDCKSLVTGSVTIAKMSYECMFMMLSYFLHFIKNENFKITLDADSITDIADICEFVVLLDKLKQAGIKVNDSKTTEKCNVIKKAAADAVEKKKLEEAAKLAAKLAAKKTSAKLPGESLGQFFDRTGKKIMRGQFPIGMGPGQGGKNVENVI